MSSCFDFLERLSIDDEGPSAIYILKIMMTNEILKTEQFFFFEKNVFLGVNDCHLSKEMFIHEDCFDNRQLIIIEIN